MWQKYITIIILKTTTREILMLVIFKKLYLIENTNSTFKFSQ